jgi:hypothetical protein
MVLQSWILSSASRSLDFSANLRNGSHRGVGRSYLCHGLHSHEAEDDEAACGQIRLTLRK